MSVTCIARFTSIDALDTAYRDCIEARLSRRTVLGFHLDSTKLEERDFRPARAKKALVFAVDSSHRRMSFHDSELREILFTAKTPAETASLLMTKGGYHSLKKSALRLEEAFCSGAQSANAVKLKRPSTRERHFDIYAEFPTAPLADQARQRLLWLPFERIETRPFVLSAEKNPNTRCVQVIVTSVSIRKIRALGLEIGATRITRNFQELYHSQELAQTAADVR